MTDPKTDADTRTHATHATHDANLSTEHQHDGDARRPGDTLDKNQPQGETIPRKSSLLDNS